MADQVDDAQVINDLHLEAALRKHSARPRAAGRNMCANLDCGEPISDYRRQGGAQLCVACQHAEEQQARHFATWRGR
jgi:RNA polymerase-binding transcription factor DksA